MEKLPRDLCLLVYLLIGFVQANVSQHKGELVGLKSLEAQLEMCFVRKVKTYCDTKTIQQDEAPAPEPSVPQVASPEASDEKMTTEYLEDVLYGDLFREYQKNSVAKPPDSKGTPQVEVGFSLIQLNHLDEKSQVLTTSGWMEVTWIDKRLSWNVSDYDGISSIIVPAEELWLPDMALQNSANDIYHSSLVENKFRVGIYSDGSIFWVPGGKYYTNCELDISYFPFDDQKCELHFTNWAYNGNQMNLSVQASNISLDNYQVNGEWDIVTTTAHREEKFYACCGDTPYPSIYFTIYMRRKYLFYITNIIAPCVMLSVLISLVFYLPPESGEKVSLGITCLLSCIVFLLLIAESIPKRSDSVPIISIYLAIFLTITTASICSTVVVLHVHHMGTKRVPVIVKRIVFDILARMLCMSELAYKYGTSSCRRGEHEPMESSMASSMVNSCRNPSVLGRQTNHRRSTHNGRVSNTSGGMKKSFSITDDRIAQHIMLNRNYVLEEILMHIKIFTQERAAHEQVESTKHEWTAVAQVLDKFFMSVFMSSIACSTFFVLIMLPMSKVELAPV